MQALTKAIEASAATVKLEWATVNTTEQAEVDSQDVILALEENETDFAGLSDEEVAQLWGAAVAKRYGAKVTMCGWYLRFFRPVPTLPAPRPTKAPPRKGRIIKVDFSIR